MNIAFFGSPEIASDLLEQLIDTQTNFNIRLVITQPDKPVGKRLEILPTMVKKKAQAYNIPLFDKDLVKNEEELINQLTLLEIDLCIVYAYGNILSSRILSVPKHGFWNIHPSLLPKLRGPSPIVYSLLLGETETGVTLIKLNEKMDEGPIIDHHLVKITHDESRLELEKRLTKIGGELIIKNIQKMEMVHNIPITPQNNSEATYTKIIKKNYGYIPLPLLQKALSGNSSEPNDCPIMLKEYIDKYDYEGKYSNLLINPRTIVFNYYRSLSPWPGIWTLINISKGEKRLKITSVSLESSNLIINTVKLEGKNEVDFKTFNNTYNIF